MCPRSRLRRPPLRCFQQPRQIDAVAVGASSQLSASCNPTPTSYNWLPSLLGSTTSSGTVYPTVTTTYSVSGTNSSGTGNLASATVTVTPPVCSGGGVWNGSTCACSTGQFYVDGQCYTPLAATACGVERWSIKTGTDELASTVVPKGTVPTSVATLGAIPIRQSYQPRPRVSPPSKPRFTSSMPRSRSTASMTTRTITWCYRTAPGRR